MNNELGGSGGTDSSTAKEVDKSESQFLSVVMDNPSSSFFTQNEDFVYFLDTKGVNRLDKGNSEEEAIIDKSWKSEGGIGVFGSNVYVLDKDSNILKFVPSGEEFSESNYFSGDVPELGDSRAMTIDGSIYILTGDGVDKYTKGAKDDFTLSGLDKPLSSPTRILTSEDMDNIYILDNGNSRIVVVSKEGAFAKAHNAEIIKSAKDIDVNEVNKKIFVLSNDKIYQIDIK